MLKTRHAIAAVTVLLLLCAAVSLLLLRPGRPADTASIVLDGVCIRTIDLRTAPDQEFTVESDYGSNTVSIESGRLHITAADCPDQICVRSGWLTQTGLPLVCLPHRLVITLDAAAQTADTDAISS